MNEDKSMKELEEELEKEIKEVEKIKKPEKKPEEKLEKEEERPEKKKKFPTAPEKMKINIMGMDIEFEVPPVGEVPKVQGIPEEADPDIDDKLWYLRYQLLTGGTKHHRVQEALDNLRELLPEDTVKWIENQFDKPMGERKPIPLTGESEKFLTELFHEMMHMVFAKFPDAPEEEANEFVQGSIVKGYMKAGSWAYPGKIKKSAKGILANLLKMGG